MIPLKKADVELLLEIAELFVTAVAHQRHCHLCDMVTALCTAKLHQAFYFLSFFSPLPAHSL